MSSVVIAGNTSGSVTLAAPDVAGTTTLTLPATTGTILTTTGGVAPGTSGNALVSNGTSWTSGKQTITSGTTVASTSGTSIDFTGIPSWAKRITVMFNGVSTNGTSAPQIQIGSGSITTSGYVNGYSIVYGTNLTAISTATSGFVCYLNSASDLGTGTITISLISNNTYIASGILIDTSTGRTSTQSGSISLGGALDRIRITTLNGTNTFDAGSINILYE